MASVNRHALRRSAGLLIGTALASCLATGAFAQVGGEAPTSAQASPPGMPATSPISGPQGAAAATAGAQPAERVTSAPPAAPQGLGEIVVTAQRREQRLQDVPIAITAISQATLQANRVQSVQDLSGLAPNLTVRQSSGSIGIPSFTMRGITSYGVVPGSDKEISIYIDGVYLGSPRGAIFDLPDIERIEVLRGPQGTLFGRNATAGAISITSRNPTGTFGARQEISLGNLDYVRSRTTIDSPQFGPFSAYVTYMRNSYRGAVRNLGAGTTWDRSASPNGGGVQTSPRYLGDKNANSVFFALKFEPSDNFNSVYKFDYLSDHFTPEAQAPIAVNPAALPAQAAGLLRGVLAASPALQFTTTRPDAVNNSWATPGFQRVYGHSLTSNLQISDDLSLKNIASYRKTFIRSNAQIDGLGGLVYPFPPIAGARFVGTVTQNRSTDEQASDELQANYNSRLLTLTVGGLYFWQRSAVGGPENMFNTTTFGIFPGGVIPAGNISESRVRSTSIAGYGQAELHVTSRIDVVGGVRVTRDHKEGFFRRTGALVNGAYLNDTSLPFDYKKTKPNYSVGVNWKITNDILLYGKYSTAFVSGGSIGGVEFDPEEAKSWEGGVKADFFDRRLRTNLALFTTKYLNVQSAQSGTNFGRPDLSTVVINAGNERAKGVELEVTAVPFPGLTLGASGGYTDARFTYTTPAFFAYTRGPNEPTFLPKYTANLSGQYLTQPVFGESRVLFRIDANWRDKYRVLPAGQVVQSPAFGVLEFVPDAWVVNGRIALQKLKLGPLEGEVAFWGRNITQNRAPTFALNFGGYVFSTTFQQARTYGGDLIVKF